MSAPLKGIKILDLSRVMAGPYATQVLAALGAEVIKIEKPVAGDDTRHWGPPYTKRDDNEKFAAYFLSLNSGKKSVEVDISTPNGQAVIRRLASQSDVVIENFMPGKLKEYGLDYDNLKQVKPDLIYCSITGFGLNNSMSNQPGYDFVVQALGGMMSITGEEAGEPVRTGVAVVDISTGLYAITGILAALYKREKTGEGEYIDVSLINTAASVMSYQAMNYQVSRKNPGRRGNKHPNIAPYEGFRVQDGYVVVGVGNDKQYQKFCEAINRPDLAADEKYKTNTLRVENREHLSREIQNEMLKYKALEIQQKLWDAGVPGGKVNEMSEVFELPPVKQKAWAKNGFNQEIMFTDIPLNFRNCKLPEISPPPALGEHTAEVLTELDDSTLL